MSYPWKNGAAQFFVVTRGLWLAIAFITILSVEGIHSAKPLQLGESISDRSGISGTANLSFARVGLLRNLHSQATAEFTSPYAVDPAEDPIIRDLIDRVSDSTLYDFILSLQNFGTRDYSADNRDSVSRWISAQFQEMGLPTVQFDTFYVDNLRQRNVIATIPGTTNPERIIVIGAHYDSDTGTPTWAPGADDNASGTAAVLEIARVLAEAGYRPKCTVRFVAFAAEEAGLHGSKFYAAQARLRNDQIILMVNLDMIGYLDPSEQDRDVMIYCGFDEFGEYVSSTAARYTTLSPILYRLPNNWADAASFTKAGYAAVFLMEADFSPYYHQYDDIVDYLNIHYANEITRTALATAVILSDSPWPPSGLTVTDMGDGSRLSVQWEPSPDPAAVATWLYLGRHAGKYDSTLVLPPTQSSYMLQCPQSDTVYYIGVAAVNAFGRESFVIERSEAARLVPRAPVSVEASVNVWSVRLQWAQNREADLAGYNVYRRDTTTATFSRLNLDLVKDTLFVDSLVTGGVLYQYAVTALDSSGNESPFSLTVSSYVYTLDRGILVLDDTPEGPSVAGMLSEGEQDSFYASLFYGYRMQEHDIIQSGPPSLRALGRHSTVIWHGDWYARPADIVTVWDSLAQYARIGGKVLISAWNQIPKNVDAETPRHQVPPPPPWSFSETSSLYQYLGIAGADYVNTWDFSGTQGKEGYPNLTLDTTKLALFWNGSLKFVELLEPADAVPLYEYVSAVGDTAFTGKICAIKHALGSGTVIYLGFPLLYIDQDDARAFALRVMEEFGEKQTEVAGGDREFPMRFVLHQNYPNPFNPSTTIGYELPARSRVVLKIYNLLGQEVATLVDEETQAGRYEVMWDAGDFSSGVYFYQLGASEFVQTKKLILLR